MRVVVPSATLRDIRDAYVFYASALREGGYPYPRYRCFRCKVLAAAVAGLPVFFSRRTRCPKGYRSPYRAALRCPLTTIPPSPPPPSGFWERTGLPRPVFGSQ
jgi:hypothetical protein